MAGRKKAKPTKRRKVAARPTTKRVPEPSTAAAKGALRKLEGIIRKVDPDFRTETLAALPAPQLDRVLAEIEEDFAATRERIRQIEAKALEKLMQRRRQKP